jgi:hypothetical protein
MEEKKAPALLGRVIPPMEQYDYFSGAEEVPFPGDAGTFSLEASWWLAEMSLLAYEPANFAANILRFIGFTDFRFWANKSTEAYAVRRPGLAILVFRGTELKSLRSIMDLYTDARFLKAELLGGHVHQGFKEGVMRVWEGKGARPPSAPEDSWTRLDGLGAYMEEVARNPGTRVYITGHSLGAALATIASALFPKAAALYTYGSPMVGDAAFAAALKVPCYRWVNNQDAVTLLPPPDLMKKLLKYSYAHCGQEHFIDAQGKLTAPTGERSLGGLVSGSLDRLAAVARRSTRSPTRLRLFLRSLGRRFRAEDIPLVGALVDHAPVNYSVRIWNALRDQRVGGRA